jgi:hypothetical protein
LRGRLLESLRIASHAEYNVNQNFDHRWVLHVVDHLLTPYLFGESLEEFLLRSLLGLLDLQRVHEDFLSDLLKFLNGVLVFLLIVEVQVAIHLNSTGRFGPHLFVLCDGQLSWQVGELAGLEQLGVVFFFLERIDYLEFLGV